MYGGLVDRVHDLLLCGVDPHEVDLRGDKDDGDVTSPVHREMDALLIAASRHDSRAWRPSCHAFSYGPPFRSCMASLCLVKVGVTVRWRMLFYPSLSLSLSLTLHFVF